MNTLIQNDPFYKNGIASYEIIEWLPSMAASNFSNYVTS